MFKSQVPTNFKIFSPKQRKNVFAFWLPKRRRCQNAVSRTLPTRARLLYRRYGMPRAARP